MRVSPGRFVLTVAFCFQWSVVTFAQQDTRDLVDANHALDVYLAFPAPLDRSARDVSEVTIVFDKLNALDRQVAHAAVLERIATERSGKALVKWRFLLETLTPSLRAEFLSRAAGEANPRQKRNFIRLADTFWDRDTLKFLVAQLDDKSPADAEAGASPRSVRICDYALNVLNEKLRQDLGLRIGVGTGAGDAIVPDVAIGQRDQWIGTLKNALIAKYGSDLAIGK